MTELVVFDFVAGEVIVQDTMTGERRPLDGPVEVQEPDPVLLTER